MKGLAMKARHASILAATLGRLAALTGACLVAPLAHAQAPGPGLASPTLVLKESVMQMPRGEAQEVRVLTAAFKPGDKTVFHTHRSPVTVYVLEGQFTLDLDGRPPVVVGAGQAFVEPPNVKMTGYNKSSTEPLRVVIFYVSEPGTPFLEPAH
jgi:quercetin dioxygenase-like cupin family protein